MRTQGGGLQNILDETGETISRQNADKISSIAPSRPAGGMTMNAIPHKQAVIPYLDNIDPVAKDIGAVNTLKFENKTITKSIERQVEGILS